MPAARDIDWTHVHVAGDRSVAAQHLPFARKLLGYVKQDASFNNLGVHKAVRRLEDGTIVTAEIHGAIPRITIQTVPKQDAPKIDLPESFVTTPMVAGGFVDATRRQVVLQSTKSAWNALFYSHDHGGSAHDAVAAPRGYYGWFRLFRDGLNHAGNIDFRAKNGMRVSWQGPSSRYWYDGWRQPNAQYGRKVYMLGQVLLDIDAYCTASGVDFSERLVVGAAIDPAGKTLVVMQAAMTDLSATDVPSPFFAVTDAPGITFPDNRYYTVAGIGEFKVTPPAPVGPVALRLVRYTLVDAPTSSSKLFTVANGSAAVLWTGSLTNACNPWFFREDCREAVTFSTPSQVGKQVVNSIIPTGNPVMGLLKANLLRESAIDTTSYRYTLSITSAWAASVATTPQSFPPGAGEQEIAVDYGKGGARIALLAVRGSEGRLTLKRGDTTLDLYALDPAPDNPAGWRQTCRHTRLQWADLRADAYVTYLVQFDGWIDSYSFQGQATNKVNVVAGGKTTTLHEASHPVSGSPPRASYPLPYYAAFRNHAANTVSPAAMLYCTLQLVTLFDDSTDVGYYNNWAASGDEFTGLNLTTYRTPVDEFFGGCNLLYQPAYTYRERGATTAVQDGDGKRWVLGAAAWKGKAAVSTRAPKYDPATPDDFTWMPVSFLTDSTMPARTSIGGEKATYYPIWLTGEISRPIAR